MVEFETDSGGGGSDDSGSDDSGSVDSGSVDDTDTVDDRGSDGPRRRRETASAEQTADSDPISGESSGSPEPSQQSGGAADGDTSSSTGGSPSAEAPSGESRQLRRDATSDPMRQQTKTQRRDTGSTGSTGSTGTTGSSRNTPTGATDPVIEGPGDTGTTRRTGSTGTTESTDPTGSTGSTGTTGTTDSVGPADPPDLVGPRGEEGQPGEFTDFAHRDLDSVDAEQGAETSSDRVGDAAGGVEQDALDALGWTDDPRDVRVTSEEQEDGSIMLETELTERGETRLAQHQRQQIVDDVEGIDHVGDVAVERTEEGLSFSLTETGEQSYDRFLNTAHGADDASGESPAAGAAPGAVMPEEEVGEIDPRPGALDTEGADLTGPDTTREQSMMTHIREDVLTDPTDELAIEAPEDAARLPGRGEFTGAYAGADPGGSDSVTTLDDDAVVERQEAETTRDIGFRFRQRVDGEADFRHGGTAREVVNEIDEFLVGVGRDAGGSVVRTLGGESEYIQRVGETAGASVTGIFGTVGGVYLDVADATDYVLSPALQGDTQEFAKRSRLVSASALDAPIDMADETFTLRDRSERRPATMEKTVSPLQIDSPIKVEEDRRAEVLGGLAGGAVVTGGVGAATRGARLARSGGRGSLDLSSPVTRSRRRARSFRERAPDVSVRRNPDAPLLEIDPYLKKQIRDSAPGKSVVADRVRGGANRFRSAIDDGASTTSSEVFGRPMRKTLPPRSRSSSSSTSSRDVFGRPLAKDVDGAKGVAQGVEGTVSRVRSAGDSARGSLPNLRSRLDDIDLDTGASTTSSEVFGRPMRQTLPPRSRSSSSSTSSRDVFGRPLAKDVGSAGLSERLLSDRSLPNFRSRIGSDSGGRTRSSDVFGRPLADDLGETPLSERLSPNTDLRDRLSGSDTPGAMSSRDVFGRPLADDSGGIGFSSLSDLNIQVRPLRPPRQRTIDVDDLGEPQLGDTPSTFRSGSTEIDIDVDAGSSGGGGGASGASGGGQQLVSTMRLERRSDAEATAPPVGTSTRPSGVFPAAPSSSQEAVRSRLRGETGSVQEPTISEEQISSPQMSPDAASSDLSPSQSPLGGADTGASGPTSRLLEAQQPTVEANTEQLGGEAVTTESPIDTRDTTQSRTRPAFAETGASTGVGVSLSSAVSTGLKLEPASESKLTTDLAGTPGTPARGRPRPFGIRGDSGDDTKRRDEREIWSRTLERDLINPFTGE